MRPRSRALLALAGYVVLALGLTWPLARHFSTHLTGDVSGDTGVYVWNLWIFRHELVEHRRAPFSTDHVLAYSDGDDFTLHNYTPVAGAVATPLIEPLGLVPTFNLIFLALIVTTALGTYALARQARLSPPLAWLAGALFAASPVLVAKSTAHFSLVAAAPLPLFLWALFRALESARIRDGILVGVITAWATYSDAYFGIYCGLMGLVVLGVRGLRVERAARPSSRGAAASVLDALLLVLGSLLAWRVLSGSTAISLGVAEISIRTLYTPVLVLTILAAARAWLVWRPVVRTSGALDVRRLWKPGLAAVLACAWLQLPMFVGLVARAAAGRLPETATYWRSSPRGVDLLAYLAPNPSHPLFGRYVDRLFLPDRPDAFPEYVAAFPLVALAVIGIAAWRRALPRVWVVFTLVFVALSLGPFVIVAGVDTYVPGPWALLRFVPAIGMARSPSRFAIVAALGLSMLFVYALQSLVRQRGSGTAVSAVVLALLAFELLPAPRTLHSAEVPAVYQIVAAADDDSTRVLELPTGIRDGTSSVGDFGPASQYFQTRHGHPLIGGYLSRVPASERQRSLRTPMLRALFLLSQREPLEDADRRAAIASRDAFLRRACIGYVVVDRGRASPDLVDFATEALDLGLVHDDEHYALYVPREQPPCRPSARGTTAR
jgi:hypothetical protein